MNDVDPRLCKRFTKRSKKLLGRTARYFPRTPITQDEDIPYGAVVFICGEPEGDLTQCIKVDYNNKKINVLLNDLVQWE